MKKILTVLTIITALTLFIGCDGAKNNIIDSEENSKSRKEIKTYKMNDEIQISNSNGEMKIKFLNVTETNERNEYCKIVANRVIIIELQYENISIDNDIFLDESNLKIYDKNNNLLETYPVEVSFANGVSIGRKNTYKIAYALNSNENYLEVELWSYVDNKNLNKKIILEW